MTREEFLAAAIERFLKAGPENPFEANAAYEGLEDALRVYRLSKRQEAEKQATEQS